MANIQPQIDDIRRARYGRDVRESIASGLEAMNVEADDAYNAAITAQNSATNSAQQAAQSATEAENFNQQAKTNADNAQGSATNAQASATSAQTSAQNAQASATQAQTYLNTVAQDAQDAKTAANDAKGSATQAQTSATNAAQSATDAQTSRQQAAQSAQNAQTSATTANNAQTSASISATNAKTSEQNAYNYAQQAQAAANVGIATTSKAGLVMPDGTTINVDQFGRISVAGLNEHIAESLLSQDGVHGVRIYVDPTTNLISLQRWDADAQEWANLINGLKPDGESVMMDDDGTLHAKSGHELVTTEAELEEITQTSEKVVEAFLVKQLIQKGAVEYSEIHVHTTDSTLFGVTVTAELTYNVEGLTETVTTTFNNEGYAKLRVYNIGTYTVTVAGTTPQTVVIDSFTIVSINVEKFSTNINLNLGGGADVTGQTITVKATDGGTPITKQVVGATGVISVNRDNTTYTLSATITDARGMVANSSIDTVAIAGATGPYNASLKFSKIEITVTCEGSAEITIAKGTKSITYTMSEAGTQTFSNFVDAGEWNVTGNVDDEIISDVIGGDSYTLYTKEYTAKEVYGVSHTVGASSTVWGRVEKSEGMTATASVGTTAGHSDFENIYPWSAMKRETLSTGDVVVKIPEFYYQRYIEDGVEYQKISGKPLAGFERHPGSGLYIGAYKTSSNNRSIPNATPQVSQTRATMRANAKAKGAGWSLASEAAWAAVRMLYLVEFADTASQVKLGRGWVDGNTASLKTGSCDALPTNGIYLTGRPAGTDGKTGVIYRGIEDPFGNIWEFVDGYNFYNGQHYVCTDPAKFADDTATGYTLLNYTGATNWSASYITKNGVDTSNAWADLPQEAGSGSETTGYADAAWSNTGWRVAFRLGAWDDASRCGFWALYANYVSSDTYTAIGSRLLYSPS